MRDFLLIFRVLFKNQNSRRIANNGRRKLPQHIVNLLCMLPFAILICIAVGFIAVIIPNAEALALISNVIVCVVQMFALFMTMLSVMNTLYGAPDTPFLNTLPVSQTAVFFAKFTIAYLNTLALTATILLPSLLTMAIVYAAMGGAMFYGYFALVFLIVLIAPILPLFIITVFSMPISYLGTFFKGKSVLKTVISLLFYVAVMIGYLLLIYFLGNDNSGTDVGSVEISGTALAGLDVFAKVIYPNKVLIDFCMSIDAGRNFGISFAITAGMIVLMLVLAMLFYRRLNQRRLETANDTSHGSISYKQSSAVSSLIKKDFKNIVRNPNLATSSLATALLCPVITAIMYFTSDMQASAEGTPEYLNSMLKLSYLVLYSMIFLGGSNMMAMLAYTREGHSFYLTKSLPINAKDSIKAKFILSLIPSAMVMVIQLILAIALYKLDVISVILFLVCVSLAIVGASALHIYYDMRFGNVNWNTRQDLKQVSQSNKGSIVVALVTVAIGCLALIGGIVLSTFADAIGGKTVVLSVFWSILFVLSLALFITGLLVLKYKAEPFYDLIGERKFKPKSFTRRSHTNRGNGNMLIK